MADPTFADFTLETAPAVTDFLVGYRTAVTGGERQTALSSLNSLFQANITTGLTANALLQAGGSGALTATNLTYSTPTLSVPDAFAISGAGSIALTAGGSNNNITLTPSGTGFLKIVQSGASAAQTFSWYQSDGTTRRGYFGYAGIGSSNITLAQEEAGGNLIFSPGSGGAVHNLSTAAASSYTSGSLINDGGFGNAGKFYQNDTIYLTPNTGAARYILLNGDGTLTGSLVLQAGGGSAAYGAALLLYSHSHATKPGWITAGISSGSGGKFSVNNQALGAGTDVFTVDSAGLVVLSNTTEATIAGAGSLTTAGGFRAAKKIVSGTAIFDGSANTTITGGAGNMTITAGTGNSRTLTLRTTTSGGTATNAVVFSATQAAAFTSTIATAAGVTWDLGALTTATVALDTTRYLAVTVGGVAYKILVST